MKTIQIRSNVHSEMLDITREVSRVVSESGVKRGFCMVYVPHTTAGVTINENADPDVPRDMLSALEKAVPWQGDYHHSEGNSAAHVKSSLLGHSVLVPVEGGQLVLGTWQAIFFCEFDGPRHRSVHVTTLSEPMS